MASEKHACVNQDWIFIQEQSPDDFLIEKFEQCSTDDGCSSSDSELSQLFFFQQSEQFSLGSSECSIEDSSTELSSEGFNEECSTEFKEETWFDEVSDRMVTKSIISAWKFEYYWYLFDFAAEVEHTSRQAGRQATTLIMICV